MFVSERTMASAWLTSTRLCRGPTSDRQILAIPAETLKVARPIGLAARQAGPAGTNSHIKKMSFHAMHCFIPSGRPHCGV